MTKKIKKLNLLSIILVLTLVTFGCTNSQTNSKITTDMGTLKEQSTTNNKNYISLETDTNTIELEVERLDMFEPMTIGKQYIVAYDENNMLKSIKNIELSPIIKDPQIDEVVENIKPVSEFSTDNLTSVNEYTIDFDKDGSDEKILVYVNAEKIDGEFLWDDGHRWVLLLEDGDKKYVLFDNHVQLGALSFYAYFQDENFIISTIQSGTASLTLSNYIYDKSSDSFSKIIQYNPDGNINMFIQPHYNY